MSKKKLNVEGITNELEGASLFFNPPPLLAESKAGKKPLKAITPKSRTPEVRKSVISEVAKSRSPQVPKSGSSEVLDLSEYPIVTFQELARLDVRVTWEQKEYLDKLETAIVRNTAGSDKSDPESQRLTKNSVLRSLVEIARQLKVNVDASSFRNERDLIKAVFDALRKAMNDLQNSEVR